MRAVSRITPTLRRSAAPWSRAASGAPNIMADLADKVIVVAGAGNPPDEEHGIGAFTSISLARQGAKVISVSNVAVNCETVTKAINDEGNHGFAVTADCTKYGECEQLLKTVKDKYGKVDVLINAGIHLATPMGMTRMTPERWQQGVDINLNAHFNLVHSFLPLFLEQERGNIQHFTTFGSALALGMVNQRHSYFAGKAAAATLTRRVGIENAKKGIRANVVSIGYTSGPLVDRAIKSVGADLEAVNAKRAGNVPRGTQITVAEVANVAVFLASDASSGMNAAEVFVDGGGTACTYGP